MIRCFLIATFVFAFQLGFAQYQARHFGSGDGLASAYTQTIVQDSLGFLWIQYPGGLTRYDGYNFKIYKHDPRNPERSPGVGGLSKVMTDHQGNVWVLGHYASPFFHLNKYNRKTESFIKYKVNITRPVAAAIEGKVVQSVCFEKSGNALWLATRSGLYHFNTETQITSNFTNKSTNFSQELLNNFVTDVSLRDSFLLLSTRNGLWKFDRTEKTFSRPDCNPKDSTWLYQAEIWKIFDEPNYNYDDVWLVGNQGFSKVNKNLSILKRFDLPGGLYGFGVFNYTRDKTGVFWIASVTQGLNRYDPSDNSLINVRRLISDATVFSDNVVNSATVDRDQNIWVASDRGITRLQKQKLNFYNFDIGKGDSSVVFSGIHSSIVYHALKKDYLIINHYKKDDIHEILISPINPNRLDSLKFFPLIHSLKGRAVNGFYQGKHTFWISVWGTGVKRISLNSETGMIEPVSLETLAHDPNNKNTISSNFPLTIMEDAHENLWVGSQDKGITKVLPGVSYGTQGSVMRYQHVEGDSNSLISDEVMGFYPEDENSFWVVTNAGVDLFTNGRFKHVFKDESKPRAFHKADDGNLFVGCLGGLYEGKKSENEYRFEKLMALNTEDILAIQADRLGRLWISTAQGIVCYDRYENTAIEFNEKDGMRHWRSMYSNYTQYETRNGIIVISDYDGISLFDPLSFIINHKKTVPRLTGLMVNNQLTRTSATGIQKDQFTVKSDITVLEELILDYQHNNFSLEFSAMELTSPEKNLYRHKLEGYDHDWIESDWKSRTATYTNLDAGKYSFKVKASNYHGIWNDNETTLSVVILPPPWKTWWAYTIYALLFLGVILYWRGYEIKRVKLKQRAEHLTELDNLKTRFFTNISHEFRTPITLILGPLKEIYNQTTNTDQKNTFGVMIRNGQRLLRLINQLLDLNKLEAGKMQLHATKVELVEVLREIGASYESLAAGKGIKYAFYPEVPELVAFVDKEKIEKVIHNILSNALKFTNEGEVNLRLKVREKQSAVITVTDTGEGIPGDQLDKVFDRFYQVDSSQTRAHEGSGLGMALAKELVELHHGKISVESEMGKGTTFTVLIPLSKETFRKEQNVINDIEPQIDALLTEAFPAVGEVAQNGEPVISLDQRPVVLIVEDNADMRNYIRRTLSEHYHIIEAADGKQGVMKAEETVPDMIISDIMMPEMDGYKLCELIKTNELTSHIPVILLTAKADRESKLAGLETGADDYLSKPFDGDELKLIIRNRIEQRRKMRERFSREITLEPRQIAITSLDEKFIQKVLGIIEVHMDDEAFSIVDLSRESGYSHIHFYRKIKALSGQTPNLFLRTIRLKRAAELLRNKSDNVSQIAFSVGFSSQSYFIKCFKEQFGMTPGEFVDSNKTKT